MLYANQRHIQRPSNTVLAWAIGSGATSLSRTEARDSPSPAELRLIFARNLRRLCAPHNSISDVCRAIGINRTQFSRYLSGESFPRPDILAHICSYFGVDANILIRDLDHSSSKSVLHDTLAEFAALLPGHSYRVSQGLFPDGVYRTWRRSFMFPDTAFSTLCRVWREGDVTCWKAYEPTTKNILMLDTRNTLPERGSASGANVRVFRGFALAISGAVSIIAAPPDSNVIRITMLQSGQFSSPNIYSGTMMLLRGRIAGHRNTSPVMYERLSTRWSDLLADARGKFFHEKSELPSQLADFLYCE